jgi:hypothetical protein
MAASTRGKTGMILSTTGETGMTLSTTGETGMTVAGTAVSTRGLGDRSVVSAINTLAGVASIGVYENNNETSKEAD